MHTKIATPHVLIQLFSPVSISDCKHALDMGQKPKFRQGLLMKRTMELAKPSSNSFIASNLHCWAGLATIDYCISASRNDTNMDKNSQKRISKPKVYHS